MSDDPQIKKLLEALGLESLLEMVDPQALGEIEAEIAELGGIDNVMADKLPPAPPPRVNPAFGLPGAQISERTTKYRCTEQHPPEVHEGQISDVGPVEIITRSDTVDGDAVWRIDMRRVDNGMSFHHDVIVRAADHRLIRHEAGTPMRLFKGFVAGEWAHLAIKGGLGKAARERLPDAAFASLWSLWTALASAPLAAGWSTSASLYVKAGTFDWHFIPIRLAVSGEERVTVPAGTFDCWVIDARGEGDKRRVDDRYWVSRGENGTRVVARAQEQRYAGTTRFYELAGIGGLTAPPEAPGPTAAPAPERATDARERMKRIDQILAEIPEASDPVVRNLVKLYAFDGQTDMVGGLLESLQSGGATLDLTVPDASMTIGSIPMRPSLAVISREEIERRVDESVRRIPSLAELRDSDNLRPGTPSAVLERYERERREYGDDVRAMWELHNARSDYLSRRVTISAAVTVNSDEARTTRVRLTVPEGVGIELPHEELGMEEAVAPPLPMKAPLDQHRKRFVRRLVARTHQRAAIPLERYSTPDGSPILVAGAAPASRSEPMMFQFAITFAAWESVKPFTLTYDIAPEGMPTVSGTVRIGTHAAT
jgi:hypothetical protein